MGPASGPPLVLDQWAKQFQVSAADAFALLAHVRIREIDRRGWQGFASEVHVDDAARARAMAEALPDEFARLRKQAVREGLKHPVLERLQ